MRGRWYSSKRRLPLVEVDHRLVVTGPEGVPCEAPDVAAQQLGRLHLGEPAQLTELLIRRAQALSCIRSELAASSYSRWE